MYRTIVGLILAAMTGLVLYLMSRKRYKCPYCGRVVQWNDELCPHCGDDMKFRHRVGPPPSRITQPPLLARTSAPQLPRRRGSRRSGAGREK